MSIRRISLFLLVAVVLLIATGISTKSNSSNGDSNPGIIVGRNVNMVPYPLIDPVTGDPVIDTGDPYLQRQNEPSMAVSTRNPMHLLAAANDYRTVDEPFSEGPLPGIDLAASASGDAWLGVFKSYNGGQSWITDFLPGYPQDRTAVGMASPLREYSTACDATVRAGVSGLFFTSGIAFNRTKNGRSAIFVARYIDNNTQAMGDMDSIKYLGVNIIDEGTSGQFADKPWIAVDAPNDSSDPVWIEYPGLEDQDIPRFNVYIVYSIFLGDSPSGDHSKIMFAKSTDCGKSFGKPIKLSESVHVCQGTNVAVSPLDGAIYVVWRQYAREEQGVPHAIMMCKSEDFGQTFTKAYVVAEINPFDQFTGAKRFRTSTFPALAVDHHDLVYVAWSQRGEGPDGCARIVIKTSMDGLNWDEQQHDPVDDHDGGGHQFMPSLTCAGGILRMTWYDARKSLGYIDQAGNYHHHDEIADPGPTGMLHTIDAWVAQAELPNPTPKPKNPDFTDSTQVSRYLYQVVTDDDGHVTDPPEVYQAQFNFPNFPIFMEGEAPFMGDYLDITPAPMFLYDDLASWRFNTGEGPFDPTLSYITFACNRDVIPPRAGFTWKDYWPPGSDACDDWTAGLRNQNIYSAPVTNGIQFGCPVNTKPLEGDRRSFLVFVKNLTDEDKLIRLTIDAPGDIEASFWEAFPDGSGGAPPPEECPFEHCDDRIVKLYVLRHSSITLTVFVQPYIPNSLATFRVNVEEIIDVLPDGTPIIGLQSSIVLNPDPVNTKLIDPEQALEDHTPFIISEDPADVNLSDATMLSDLIIYYPYIEELLNSSNPDIAAPGLRHPGLRHDTIINPGLRHTTLGNVPEGEVTDLNWTVTNAGSTTSAYSFEAIAETPPVPHQLLIYRVATTPISAEECQLRAEEHHELLLSVESPGLRHPGLRHPGLRHPGLRHNTFFLAPGETAICTLRLIDPDPPEESGGSTQEAAIMSNGETQEDFVPEDYATTVAGAAIPQASTDGLIDFKSSLYIIARDPIDNPLPTGSVGYPYAATLEAYGGEPAFIDDNDTQDPNDDVWEYDEWSLQLKAGESLPPGFDLTSLSSDGILSGPPQYDPDATYPQDYYFTVEVKDESTPEPQIARRRFTITVACTTTITAEAGEIIGESEEIYDGGVGPGGHISPAGYDLDVVCGTNPEFEVEVNQNYILSHVWMDGDKLTDFTAPIITDTYEFRQDDTDPNLYTCKFIKVHDPQEIAAIFARIYIIEATATAGGSIEPAGSVPVNYGGSQTFIITPDEGFRVLYVLVDGTSVGAVTQFTFSEVKDDHTIHAAFGWVRRYNNDSANGNDEPSDIGVDLSGNVYVTGYSLGSPTGDDYYTIGYDSGGTEVLTARYDGPAHEGDRATAIAVDNAGNVYVTGYSYRGMPHKHSDYSTVKYDSLGNEVWNDRYDARRNGMDVATAITLDLSGNYAYVTGRSQDSESKKSDVLHYDYYTIKYNANTGRIERGWGARYNNGAGNGDDEATAIAVDFAGNVYVTGRSEQSLESTEPIYDYATVKYLPNGNMDTSWGTNGVARYDGGNNDEATDIAVDSAGNIYVTGRSARTIHPIDFDYATVKYDIYGDEKWVARYNNESVNGDDEAVAINVHEEGGLVYVYLTGYSSNGTDNDYATIKYGSDGNVVTTWGSNGVVTYHGGHGDDAATAMALDSSGNVYVTGKSQGDGTGFDFCTVKYDSSTGNVVWIDRYNNDSVNGDDEAIALAIDLVGNVYITGRSEQSSGSTEPIYDYVTIQFKQ